MECAVRRMGETDPPTEFAVAVPHVHIAKDVATVGELYTHVCTILDE